MAARSGGAAGAGRDAVGRAPRRPAAVQPPARAGACARAAVRRHPRRTAREVAAWGEPRSRRPHVQRRQDLSRAARGRRARARPAARRGRARRRAPAGHRLRRRAQPHASPGRTCCSRRANGRARCFGLPDTVGSLPRGRARSAAAATARRASARPLQRAGHLLGIQRRAHQPALACAAASVRPAAAARCSARRAAAARRRRTASAGSATTTRGSSVGGRPRAVGAGRHRTGAAACRSARTTRRASASCCSTAASHAGRRLLPSEWIARMQRLAPIAPFYGRLSGSTATAAMFPERVDATLVHGRRGRPLRLDRPGARRRGRACAGSTRRTPAPRLRASAPRCRAAELAPKTSPARRRGYFALSRAMSMIIRVAR